MLIATLVLASLAAPAQDCHQPTAGLGAHGVAWGPNGGSVYAMEVFDDGSGPALYLGGTFSIAGEIQADSLVRFDGSGWEELPGPGGASVASSTGFGIRDMEVFDDGSGPALYVAGSFDASLGLPPNGIARWDGASWSPVVSVTTQYAGFYGVTDMLVWDDGGGPALYFCGTFNKVQGQPAASIAKYTGSGWSTVGAGYSGSLASAMAAFDDGSGEKLFVAGWNWPSLQNVQVWDGSSWSINPGVFSADVQTLHVHDDGSGSKLYAGGYFSSPGAGVARWDGASWSAVGAGVQFFPWSMNTFDDGGGTQLYAVGGSYASIPPTGWEIRAARWNGTAWDYLGAGLSADANASTVFDDGSGPALYVGGNFTQAGGQRADHVARWTAAGWDEVYTSEGLVGPSEAMCVFDDGSGPALYAEGGLIYAYAQGTTTKDSVVRWTGSGWTQVGGLTEGGVSALLGYDDGGGARLHAGGSFDTIGGATANGIARWNGAAWEPLGGGLTRSGGWPGYVGVMEIHDFGSGPRLVVAGTFDFAGGIPAANVAAWDGAAWSAIGSGFDDTVNGLAVFDDGVIGPRLYAGGSFDYAGAVQVDYFARWNGSAWEPVLGGSNRRVNVLETLDLGEGPRLYAGGDFYIIGGIVAHRIARFDGSSWQRLHSGGSGLSDDVYAIAVYDEGGGPELIAGGKFPTAGGQSISNLARWDGATWRAFSEPPNGRVDALQVFDDGSGAGPALFAGGRFDSLGSTVSMCAARWAPGCPCDPVTYCTAKVNSQGCTPSIYVTGSTSLTHNTLRVHATNVLNNKNGILFWGYGSRALPFQGGWLCIQPPIVRTTVQSSGGNPPPNDCSGSLHFHWNQPYVASMGLSLGAWYYTQYWSRDPASPSTTSLTDAARFLLCP